MHTSCPIYVIFRFFHHVDIWCVFSIHFWAYKILHTKKYVPVIATLIAKAITLSPIVGVTVIKCHEFSSGYKSREQASTMPSLLQSRFLENWEKEKKKNLSGLLEYTQTHIHRIWLGRKWHFYICKNWLMYF